MEQFPEDVIPPSTFRIIIERHVAEPFENARAILNVVGNEDEISDEAKSLRGLVGLIEYDEARAAYYRVKWREKGYKISVRLCEVDIVRLTEQIYRLY